MPIDLIKLYKFISNNNQNKSLSQRPHTRTTASERKEQEKQIKTQQFNDYWKNKYGISPQKTGENEYHVVLVNNKDREDMERIKSDDLTGVKNFIQQNKSTYETTNGNFNNKTLHIYKTKRGSNTATYMGTGKGCSPKDCGQYGVINNFDKLKKTSTRLYEQTKAKKILKIIKNRSSRFESLILCQS